MIFPWPLEQEHDPSTWVKSNKNPDSHTPPQLLVTTGVQVAEEDPAAAELPPEP